MELTSIETTVCILPKEEETESSTSESTLMKTFSPQHLVINQFENDYQVFLEGMTISVHAYFTKSIIHLFRWTTKVKQYVNHY